MANYGVFGYLKTPDNKVCKNAKVYTYFKKVSSAAPASKWADVPYTASNLGYYSFDLGDDVLLGTEASIVKGTDKIYLAIVWNETNVNDQTKESLTFTHCLFIEHVTTNADFFELNLTMEEKRLPILDSITFPNSNLLTSHTYTMAETSHADYTWKSLAPYSENSISQKLIYDLVPIFDGHQMIETIYDWKEISPRTKPNSSNDSYIYDIAGVYDICVTVREKWNTEVTQCFRVTVKYNKPIPDFNWSPTLTNSWQGNRIKGQELITFTNLSSDLDDRTWNVDKWGAETYYYKWTITDELYDGSDNTQVYINKDFYFQPEHEFQSPGTKSITLEVFWNDGFNDFSETVTKTIEIYAYDIIPDFDWDITNPTNRNELVTFNPDLTSGDTSQIVNWEWVIEDSYPAPSVDMYTFGSGDTSVYGEHSPNNTEEVDNTYIFPSTRYPVVKFHSIEPKNVTLTMTYYNGWENVTESISKVVTPSKYVIEPTFTISDIAPMGRDKVVVITNTTGYMKDGVDVGYTIDWDLGDYYTECNLDNPSPGSITDNSVQLVDVSKDTVVEHNYQNTGSNDIELTIRYDDGWQMQTKRLTKSVNPIVYPAPVPEFTWDISVPTDRDQTVTFSNTTDDEYNRFRAYDWVINDKYGIYNPDNTEYGIAEVDNTQVVTYNTEYEFTPTHNFQSQDQEDVSMTYYYDDGFCERTVSKTKVVNKTEYSIAPNFATTPSPVNGGFVGPIEVMYYNSSTGDTHRSIEEKWVWNDRVFETEADEITVRENQVVDAEQPFMFTTPSRKPYSAIGGATSSNLNKEVTLEIRYDNGWDDTKLVDVTRMFEASPKEVNSIITYETNVDGYTH